MIEAGYATTDATPPTLSVSLSLQPVYFVGDTIRGTFSAVDNVQLRWLYWELQPAGIRDSGTVYGTSMYGDIGLRVPAPWIGENTLSFWAVDASGLESDTARTALLAIRALPTITRPTATATVPGEPRGALIDEKRGRVYLLQGNPDGIAFLDASSLAITTTLPLPIQGQDFDFTPGGDSLVVTLAGAAALGVIDLQSATPQLTLLPLPAVDTTRHLPLHVRTVANGRALVHLSGRVPNTDALLEVDLAGGGQRLRTDAGSAGFVGFGLLESTRDRSALILSGGVDLFQRYESSTDTFGPLRTSTVVGPPAVDASGSHVVVGMDLYDATLMYLRSIEPSDPRPVALGPAADYVYSSAPDNTVWRTRVTDGKLQDRFRIPIYADRLFVSPGGALLVATLPDYGYTVTRVCRVTLD